MDKKEKWRIATAKYRLKNKDKIKEYRDNHKESKRHWDLNNHRKIRKAQWRSQGIITNDWDNVYNVYINTTNCDHCNKKFKDNLDRNLDHDHSINDSNNIRGILCRVCNTSDVLKGYPPIF